MRILKFNQFVFLLIIVLICGNGCDSDENDDSNNFTPQSGTQISGEIEGVLSYNDSPFKIIDNLTIDTLATLTIEPGVELHFMDSTRLIIYGELISVGQQSDPIIYTSENSSWLGIKIENYDQNTEFEFCIFENILIDDPSVDEYGSLIVLNSSASFQNCIFQNNRSLNGGALSLINSNTEVYNCIFTNNICDTFGGAILSIESNSVYYNNTFYNNLTYNYGGGLVIVDPISEDVQNNIFYLNSSNTGDPRISILSGDSTNCNIQFNFLWSSNMDPQFVSDNDFNLKSYSPCIDNGNPDPSFNDADGSRNDQGAYGGPRGNW